MSTSIRALLCLATLCLIDRAALAQTDASAAPLRPPTLEELFTDQAMVDTAMSPSGRHIAAILRRSADDLLVIVDMQNGERKIIQRTGVDDVAKNLELRMATVYWKSDERLLVRITIRPDEGVEVLSDSKIGRLGDRLVAINRDGSKVVALLGENRNSALAGAFNLGAIGSFLPHDPTHILMVLDGFNGRSLFKVDLDSGKGEQIEKPSSAVVGWWLDVHGNPAVRMTVSNGSIHLFRKDGEKWQKFHSKRVREMRERDDYEMVGASDQPGKFYVLARPPGRDRMGLYLYDLEKNSFGEPLVENAKFDLHSAAVTRDGQRVRYHCYTADVKVCEFGDPKFDSHMKGIRRYFADSANVLVYDSSEDARTLILYVQGPREPAAYYYYTMDKRSIEKLGGVQTALENRTWPQVAIVNYKARDGQALSGYLSTPANAPQGTKLPLVLMPHGGPEMRDHLTFDPWVQYLVSLGYAVFQPNFRGSDGFGRAFAESGYGEWGRKMQDDISDGLRDLVDRGVADPARVCIVGASYGGYAALAGASLTPDLYKCSVSISGISDLDDFIAWRKRNWGRESEGYTYWLKAIGNPDTQEARLREVSPLHQAAKIRIPVLLIHGTDDMIVPVAQSKAMKKALERSGARPELIELKHEGHSYWSTDNEMYALSSVGAFLWKNLGAGVGVSSAPVVRAVPRR